MAKSEWDRLIDPLHHLQVMAWIPPQATATIQLVEVQDKLLHRLWSELTRISRTPPKRILKPHLAGRLAPLPHVIE